MRGLTNKLRYTVYVLVNEELIITTLTYNKIYQPPEVLLLRSQHWITSRQLFKLYYSDLNTGQHPGTTWQSHIHTHTPENTTVHHICLLIMQ
jgi:hypothetical protein